MSLMPLTPPFSDPPITVAAVSTNNVFPTVLDGDLGLLMECHSVYGFASAAATPTLPNAPDFTTIYRQSSTYSRSGLWGRVTGLFTWRWLTAGLSGTSIGSAALASTLLVLRHPRNRTVTWKVSRLNKSTASFNEDIQFGEQVSPIIPIFYVHKYLFQTGTNILLSQPAPAVLFDGAPVTYYDTSITGVTSRVALLTGAQSPRLINVDLDAANPGGNFQITRHAAIDVRRRETG